jgi:hypothetical protein
MDACIERIRSNREQWLAAQAAAKQHQGTILP